MSSFSLPRISVFNARSLFPKIGSLVTDMNDRDVDVSFISEIWEQENKKKHQQKIEELIELNGLEYISTPRKKGKRGGVTAIIANLHKFNLSKLNVKVPRKVEAVWGLLKAKVSEGKSLPIIVCAIYSPPDCKRNAPLINHLTLTLQSLLKIHKNPGIILCGDRNHIEIPSLLSIESSLCQIVTQPTYRTKILGCYQHKSFSILS